MHEVIDQGRQLQPHHANMRHSQHGSQGYYDRRLPAFVE